MALIEQKSQWKRVGTVIMDGNREITTGHQNPQSPYIPTWIIKIVIISQVLPIKRGEGSSHIEIPAIEEGVMGHWLNSHVELSIVRIAQFVRKPASHSVDCRFEPHCRRGVFSGVGLWQAPHSKLIVGSDHQGRGSKSLHRC